MEIAGFDRVAVLDGRACGAEEPRVILAVRFYEAEARETPGVPWIHPYYPASQSAYRLARETAARRGWRLCPQLRLKPVMARLACFGRGLNTLNYYGAQGSRFHVQTFVCGDDSLPVTDELLPQPQPLQCGACRRCMEACPTGAIREDGFHRERCLRYWQLNGEIAPPAVREHMGMRLIGCDICQRCCPRQPVPAGRPVPAPPLHRMLTDPGAAARELAPLIGSNLARPLRLLAQACLLAARSPEEAEALRVLTGHPHPAVREHATWALGQLDAPARR